MSDVAEPDLICRDDNCNRLDIHPKHQVLAPREIHVHHRPSASKRAPWTRDDPKALTGAVARATSASYPTHFGAIATAVRDDYGPCSERTIYRHLSKLVERGHLVKLDLGLALAAYIRPNSRLLRDQESLREYMLGTVGAFGAPCRPKSTKQPATDAQDTADAAG